LTDHERWDGSGYPARLVGEAIPIAGRLVAVVDTFDAMTTNRPYRAARTSGEALTEISRCSGTLLGPQVAIAFPETRRSILELATLFGGHAHPCHRRLGLRRR
jgi:putative two-component system response regulator